MPHSTDPEKHATATQHPPCFSCRALLLIDVQANMLSEKKGVPSSQSVRQNIQRILDHARSAKPPPRIIHVRNCGDPSDPDAPNTPGWQLVFSPLPHEHVIDKRKNDAFADTKLGELIPRDAEVIVVGMQSEYCVTATCKSALDRGNVVILIKGAHATYDCVEIWNGGSVTKAPVIEADVEAKLEDAGANLLEMKYVSKLFEDR